MGKVSLIAAIYNKEKYLDRFMKCILNQTFEDIDIILVDNASSDKSYEIIKDYQKKDNRIRIIHLDNNIGPSGAYSVGIENVEADYFLICDPDDYFDLDYVETLFSIIISKNADMAMCRNDIVDESSQITKNCIAPQELYLSAYENISLLSVSLLDENVRLYGKYIIPELGAPWGKIYKTDVIKRYNLNYIPNRFIYCDYLFNISVLFHIDSFVFCNTIKYHYYQAPEGCTKERLVPYKIIRALLSVCDDIYILCRNKNIIGLENAWLHFQKEAVMYIYRTYVTYSGCGVSNKELARFSADINKSISMHNFFENYLKLNLSGKDILRIVLIKRKMFFLCPILRFIQDNFKKT